MWRKIKVHHISSRSRPRRDRKKIPRHVWERLQNALAHHAKIGQVKLRARSAVPSASTHFADLFLRRNTGIRSVHQLRLRRDLSKLLKKELNSRVWRDFRKFESIQEPQPTGFSVTYQHARTYDLHVAEML
jgi:hypothetical protein